MKFYDDVYTKKFYNTQEELNAAVNAFKKVAEEKKEAEAKKSTDKKMLAEAIDKADEALKIAFSLEAEAKNDAKEIYKKAYKDCASIMDKANTEASKVLKEAKQKIADAQELKCKAIEEFNSKYGAYTKVYSGEDAQKEYDRVVESISDLFSMFPFF